MQLRLGTGIAKHLPLRQDLLDPLDPRFERILAAGIAVRGSCHPESRRIGMSVARECIPGCACPHAISISPSKLNAPHL